MADVCTPLQAAGKNNQFTFCKYVQGTILPSTAGPQARSVCTGLFQCADEAVGTAADGAGTTDTSWQRFVTIFSLFVTDCQIPFKTIEPQGASVKGCELDEGSVDREGKFVVSAAMQAFGTNVDCTQTCCTARNEPCKTPGNGYDYDTCQAGTDGQCAMSRLGVTPDYSADPQAYCVSQLAYAWQWAIPILTMFSDYIVTPIYNPCCSASSSTDTALKGWQLPARDPNNKEYPEELRLAWVGGAYTNSAGVLSFTDGVLNAAFRLMNGACACPPIGGVLGDRAVCNALGTCAATKSIILTASCTDPASLQCGNEQYAAGIGKTGTCNCFDGTTGGDCTNNSESECPIDTPTDGSGAGTKVVCSGNGQCHALSTHYRCFCKDGWQGVACHEPQCGFHNGAFCSGNGDCVRGVCECTGNFGGVNCQFTEDIPPPDPGAHGGKGDNSGGTNAAQAGRLPFWATSEGIGVMLGGAMVLVLALWLFLHYYVFRVAKVNPNHGPFTMFAGKANTAPAVTSASPVVAPPAVKA